MVQASRASRIFYVCADFSERDRKRMTSKTGQTVSVVDAATAPQRPLAAWFGAGEVLRLPGTRRRSVEALFHQLARIWWLAGPRAAKANALFQVWLTDLQISRETHAFVPAQGKQAWVEEAYDGIRRAVGLGVGVDVVASWLGLSRGHFTQRFKELTDTTPGAELERQRIARACQMLAKLNKPVEVIAQRCGFSNASSLSRCFRKHMGISPGQWRKDQC